MKTSPAQQTIVDRCNCMANPAAIQQAEKRADGGDRFFEPNHQKQSHKFTRVPFQVSRLMEFCNLRELQNQTGHEVWDWPLVVLKELPDNAPDACEEVALAPVVKVSVSPKTGTMVIEDNGPGIPEETTRAVCDYTIRVSSREAYMSPSRGGKGDVLKTILTMGYVLDRERLSQHHADAAEAIGQTVIETMGIAHAIVFTVDHITNEPRLTHTTTPSPVATGTRITIKWPPSSDGVGRVLDVLDNAEQSFKALAESYAWFNPHLSLHGAWDGTDFVNVEATNPGWTKWRPSDPTSPHWYTEAGLRRYLSAHAARDRRVGQGRPVREFIAEFRGLSGTRKQKAILAEIGASRLSVRSFFRRRQGQSNWNQPAARGHEAPFSALAGWDVWGNEAPDPPSNAEARELDADLAERGVTKSVLEPCSKDRDEARRARDRRRANHFPHPEWLDAAQVLSAGEQQT